MNTLNSPKSSPEHNGTTRRRFLVTSALAAFSMKARSLFAQDPSQSNPMELQHYDDESDTAVAEADEHYEDIESLKDAMWGNQEIAYNQLLALQNLPASAIYSAKELEKAFSGEGDIVIACMDERIELPDGFLKVSIAGSGILCAQDDFKAFVKNIKTKFPRRNISVSFHEGCGACGLFCQDLDEKNIAHDEPEKEGEKLAQKEINELGLQSEPIRLGFGNEKMLASELSMTGNPNIHHARAIAIDCTTGAVFKRNALDKKKFPGAFDLSAAVFPSMEELGKEVEIALKIALGEHGMGKERFAKQKMLVALIGSPDTLLAKHAKIKVAEILKKPAYKDYAMQIDFAIA